MGVEKLFKTLRDTAPHVFESRLHKIQEVTRGSVAAIDAANHCIRLAKAKNSTDPGLLVKELVAWLQGLHSIYGIEYMYLVNDGAHSAPKFWEAMRREDMKKATERRIAAKREDLARYTGHVVTADSGALTSRFVTPTKKASPAFTTVAEKRRQHKRNTAQLQASLAKEEERHSIYLTKAQIRGITLQASRVHDRVHTLDAPGEGEMACAALVANGVASLVISNDSDVIPLGIPHTLTFIPMRPPALLYLDRVQKSWGMNQEAVRAVCMMAGTDFSPYIKGAGLKTCLKHAKAHGGHLETMLARWGPKRARAQHHWPSPVPAGAVRHEDDPCPECGEVDSAQGVTCPYCTYAGCGRDACWKAHLQPCFEACVTSSMLEAEAMFARMGRVFSEEELALVSAK